MSTETRLEENANLERRSGGIKWSFPNKQAGNLGRVSVGVIDCT